jgi:GNAT superfamily N-acetyltransferase
MEHIFYPASAECPILDVLVLNYPDVFGVFHAKRPLYVNEKLTGLFVLKVNKQVVCIAVLLNLSVDRVFTLPRFRGKGYAKALMSIFCGMSTVLGVGLVTPAYPEFRSLLERAGWKYQKPNSDGTLQMTTPLWKANQLYDAGKWLMFLTSPEASRARPTSRSSSKVRDSR